MNRKRHVCKSFEGFSRLPDRLGRRGREKQSLGLRRDGRAWTSSINAGKIVLRQEILPHFRDAVNAGIFFFFMV